MNFFLFMKNIKKIMLVIDNIIFCENKSQLNKNFINDSFFKSEELLKKNFKI